MLEILGYDSYGTLDVYFSENKKSYVYSDVPQFQYEKLLKCIEVRNYRLAAKILQMYSGVPGYSADEIGGGNGNDHSRIQSG